MPGSGKFSPSDYAVMTLMALSLCDLAIPYALGPFYPGFSHLHDTLSTLTAKTSPVQSLASAWLILYGILWAIALLPLRPARFAPIRGWMVWGALLVWALGGGVLAGLFPEDLPGHAETLSGKLHGISAGLGSLALLFAITGLSLRAQHRRAALIALTALAWIGFALFLGSKAPQSFAGLWQKTWLAAAYAALCLALIRPRRP